MKSFDISPYFEFRIRGLIPDRPITFTIYIFLRQNQRMIKFRKIGDAPTEEFIKRYNSRGIDNIWILKSEREAFEEYFKDHEWPEEIFESIKKQPSQLDVEPETVAREEASSKKSNGKESTDKEKNPNHLTSVESKPQGKSPSHSLESTPSGSKEAPASTASAFSSPEQGTPSGNASPKSQQAQQSEKLGEDLVALFQAKEIDEKRKSALAAKNARSILNQAMGSQNPNSQKQTHSAAKKTIKDILDQTPTASKETLSELWKTAEIGLENTHSTNVATYSVLIALGFGKSDPEFIADLAMAGLLHDVGISQVSAKTTEKPWNNFTSEMQAAYSLHVEASLEIINAFGPDVSDQSKLFVRQHHEKFNGHGYPRQSQGSQIELGSQILCFAELMDSISSGQWDGKKRTYHESLGIMSELEKQNPASAHFSPQFFSTVLQWVQEESLQKKA